MISSCFFCLALTCFAALRSEYTISDSFWMASYFSFSRFRIFACSSFFAFICCLRSLSSLVLRFLSVATWSSIECSSSLATSLAWLAS